MQSPQEHQGNNNDPQGEGEETVASFLEQINEMIQIQGLVLQGRLKTEALIEAESALCYAQEHNDGEGSARAIENVRIIALNERRETASSIIAYRLMRQGFTAAIRTYEELEKRSPTRRQAIVYAMRHLSDPTSDAFEQALADHHEIQEQWDVRPVSVRRIMQRTQQKLLEMLKSVEEEEGIGTQHQEATNSSSVNRSKRSLNHKERGGRRQSPNGQRRENLIDD